MISGTGLTRRQAWIATALVVAALAVALWPADAVAFCTARGLKVDVRLEKEKVKYHYNLDTVQVKSLAKKVMYESNLIIAGLYKPYLTTRYNTEYMVHRKAKKRCYYAKTVRVVMKLKRDVFVASNYTRGSCRYKVTLNHENTHVRYDEDLIDQMVAELEQQLMRKLKGKTFSSQKPVSEAVEGTVRKVMEDFGKKREKVHRTIDNPRNYKRETRLCSRW